MKARSHLSAAKIRFQFLSMYVKWSISTCSLMVTVVASAPLRLK